MKRFVFVFSLTACLFATGCNPGVQSDSATVSSRFLETVEEGNVGQAVSFFVDKKYKAMPKGGYEAYFRLTKGASPNLTFLTGHPFKTGTLVVKSITRDEFCMTDYDCGESSQVEGTLSFSPKTYSPYLLPAKLADSTGDRYSDEDVQKFLSTPATQGESFSKMLRPSIQSRSLDHFKEMVPRLKSIKITFYLARHGKTAPWKIEFFTLTQPVWWVNGEERQT